MIGISSKVFDINGSIILHQTSRSKMPGISRRVTTTATLDGNNSISDLGLAEADGQWIIRSFDSNDGLFEKINTLMARHSRVILTSSRGAFEGVIKNIKLQSMPLEITFLAEKKIS